MPINNNVSVSRFCPELSFTKTLTIADKGFESDLIYIQNYSSIAINLSCTKNCTISLIGLNHNRQATFHQPENFNLFFQKKLTENTLFQRRFNINYNYVILQVFFDQSITPPTTEATIELNTTFLSRTQFNPAAFHNSLVEKDCNSNAILNVNNHHLDLVRGIYKEFSKINVLGIHENRKLSSTGVVTYPTNPFTLGNFSADFTLGNQFSAPTSAEPLFLQTVEVADRNNGTVGANPPFSDATNTGARKLKMVYIDTDGIKQSVDIITGNGAIGVSAKSVLRISVIEAGSTNNNIGEIAVLNSLGNRIYALIHPSQNVSHTAIYQVPANKSLVLRNITINSFFQGGSLKVIENKNGLEYVLGVFAVNTNNNLINYDLDGLVEAGSYIYVNVIPDGTTGGNNHINCNINAFECPLINNF